MIINFDKKLKSSFVCALALMVSTSNLNADYVNSFLKPIKIEKVKKHSTKKYISDEEYALICENFYKMHNAYWTFLVMEQNYFKELEGNEKIQEKQRIKKLLKNLEEVIKVAKERIENKIFKDFKKQNEKVYYSSLAVKNILEEITDDNFMELVGGINLPKGEYLNIIEYGKGIEKAEETLKVLS